MESFGARLSFMISNRDLEFFQRFIVKRQYLINGRLSSRAGADAPRNLGGIIPIVTCNFPYKALGIEASPQRSNSEVQLSKSDHLTRCYHWASTNRIA